jgi:Winged helix-turn helix
VEAGPIPAVDGVVRWRACDLIMRLHEEFGISVLDDTVYRALKDLSFSHVSARPKAYKQDADAMEAFKKISRRMAEVRTKLAPGTSIEVWRQDEMRVGQKNKRQPPVRLSITHNSGFVRSSARWGKLESKESLMIHC